MITFSLGLKKIICYFTLALCFLVSFFVFLTGFSSFALSLDTQAGSPQTMLILDGSGSMWGKIKDGHKVIVARNAIAGAIRPFEGKLNLGLMSYGHRKRAACLDIQLLKKPSAFNSLSYSRLVNRIKPIGKTPITSALSSAVKSLNKTGKGGSIILLADGPENCRKNPCALITPAFAKQNNLTVHVIAFSMLPKDARSLRCLSQNSGGGFYTPSNKETLGAAVTAALNLSLKTALPKAPLAKKTAPKKVIVKTGIHLSAHLGADSPALTKGISWTIEKLTEKKVVETDLPPWKSTTGKPEFDLSPGTYRIVADFDDYQVIRDIEIKKNKRELERFIFNLSQLKLPAGWVLPDSRSGFGKLLLEQQVDKNQQDAALNNKRGALVIDLTKQSETQLIPAGTYKISAIENGKMQNWFLHAGAGKLIEIPIWEKTGRVRFDLKRASDGTPLKTPSLKIYRTDLKPDKLIEVARSLAKVPQFDLASGKYLAHLTDGYSELRHSFSIQPRHFSTEELSLRQGFLNVELSKQTEEETPHLEISKLSETSGLKYITELSEFDQAIKLSPGAYRLLYRTSQSDRARVKDVQIKNGETSTVKFGSRQSFVSFSIAKRDDALSRHQIFWQLFDNKGRMVWQSVEPKPSLYLSAGTYKIVAEIGNDKFSSRVKIKGRKPKKFDLSNKQIN